MPITEFRYDFLAKHVVGDCFARFSRQKRYLRIKHANHGIPIRFSRKTRCWRLFYSFLSSKAPFTIKTCRSRKNILILMCFLRLRTVSVDLLSIFVEKTLPCPSFFDTVSFQRPQISKKSAIVERNARFFKIPRDLTMFF